jgi:hypothetical protein
VEVMIVFVLPILLLFLVLPLYGAVLVVSAALQPAQQRVARRPCDD